MKVQEHFSALELAELVVRLKLTNLPQKERGFQVFAEREGWNDLPAPLCRKRAGKGGGREYHLSIVPESMRQAIAGARMQEAGKTALAVRKAHETSQAISLNVMALKAKQRQVAEARMQVLQSIESFRSVNNLTRSRAIAGFLDTQTKHPDLMHAPDGFDLAPEVLERANNRKQGDSFIGRATLFEWFHDLDAGGFVALAPAPTKAERDVPKGFAGFLKHYAVPSKPKATDALAAYLATKPPVDQILTLDQVRYTLREKLSNIEANVGREGLLTLRSRMAYVQRTTEGMWPTTVYTADGKTFDAEVADPFSGKPMRPEITSVLDVATRKCVGFAVSRKENVIAVTEALRLSCSAHGIPAIFYTDRGTGYKNKVFDGKKQVDADVAGLMARLGITKMHALPYNSQAKGIVERFNAQWNRVARQLPSYIGVDMDKEAGGRVHRMSRKDIKEFGSSRLLPSWGDFLTLCEALIAEYNETPHQGLPRIEDQTTGRSRHLSPNEAWAQHVQAGFEPILVDPADEDDLWRPYDVRTARRALVEWNTNKYFHIDLERYHGEKVMVGYDLRQAEKVWVREFDRATGEPGKLICVATFSGNKVAYIPKTMEQAALEKRVKGQHKRVENKSRAIDAQITAAYQIEHKPSLPVDFTLPANEPKPVSLVIDNGDAAPVAAPKRRMFGSDLELAQWALENPTELTPNQIRVLRDCVNNFASREYFRMSGISEEQLRALLRSVA